MRKINLAILIIGAITLTACGNLAVPATSAITGDTPAVSVDRTTGGDSQEVQNTEDNSESETSISSQSPAFIGNPWTDISNGELFEIMGFWFPIPAGVEDAMISYNETEGLAQMLFTKSETEWVARAAKGTKLTDISGMYYTWERELDAKADKAEGKLRIATDEFGTVYSGIWYEEGAGLVYSLSCQTEQNPDWSVIRSVFGITVNDTSAFPGGSADTSDSGNSASSTSVSTPPADFAPDITFSTTDVINGTNVTEQIFAEHKLTMINFWEPWCGPCVGEMPDLQALYEEYGSGSGDVLIIGVYSDEDGASEVLSDVGTTYPVLKYVSAFDVFQTGYVPNTVFFDENGHVISSTKADSNGSIFIGGRAKADWKAIIEELLK